MMKKLTCLACACIVSISLILAQDIADISSIPEEVKKNASVIKRSENILFEVKDINSATLKTRRVFTVLNENGKNALSISHYTDKLTSLEEVEIKVFNEAGKQVGKYRKKDMNTVATGEGLIEDGKVTYITLPHSGYPVTVQYDYEEKYKGTLAYPTYRIQRPGEGIVSSSFTAKIPVSLDLRHKAINTSVQPSVKEDGAYKTYTWAIDNLPPFEAEENFGYAEHAYPKVIIAPNKFEHYGYEGSMNTWKQFGEWYNKLKKGTDILPETSRRFYQSLVDSINTDRGKVKAIYSYLQNNFRYVSIQLGVGGVKPLPAEFTEQKKYGDCKGLSNYMHSVLNSLGIKSHVALISRYDRTPVEPGFPCNLFNHMVLCVPFAKDTVWLECTSKTNEFGVLGSGTEDRYALLITENGGVLTATPKSLTSSNNYSSKTDILLAADASGKCKTIIHTSGEPRNQVQHYIFDQKKDDQVQYLVYMLGFKQANSFDISKAGEGLEFNITVDMEIDKVPEFSTSNKMFLAPRLYKIWNSKLPKAEDRKMDFYFEYPFEIVDTTIFRLPDSFKPGAIPAKKSVQNDYTLYETNYWFDEQQNAIFSTARLILKRYKIPTANYATVKTFFDEVLMDDSQRIVIEKK